MNEQTFFQSLTERLQSSASVRSVFGEPIRAEGRTIVPIARVGYGFGGGFGSRNPGHSTEHEDLGGAGGGGGMGAIPAGALEITPEGTRFVPLSGKRNLILALAAGFLIGVLAGRWGRQ